MGLPRALQLHREGHKKEAMLHYQRAVDHGELKALLFQNYGALLREFGDESKALSIYNDGLAEHPNDVGILGNRVNLLIEKSPTIALKDLLRILRISLATNADIKIIEKAFMNILNTLRDLGCIAWTLEIIKYALSILGENPRILSQLVILTDDGHLAEHIIPIIEQRIFECNPTDQAELFFALASNDVNNSRVDQSLSRFENALAPLLNTIPEGSEDAASRQKTINTYSWNFGCALLKAGNFERGWKLYEYGLVVHAKGLQRWQRALEKPFSNQQLPLWRGESLAGKHLLVIEEQGVGDVMMFMTLIPRIRDEASSLTLLLSDRLKPIYTRSLDSSYNIITRYDIKEGRYSPGDFDLSTPLGSICQYRFTHLSQYAPKVPILTPNYSRSKDLRQKYLNQTSKAEKLIGISWQGGGQPTRMKDKSIDHKSFLSIISPQPGIRFVSLQYGNTEKLINKWKSQGFDIVHDALIDPLQDMEYWLDQVAACDAVISVANTTIHGAGGLNIPTMCLLGRNPDWRWLQDKNNQRSYWYPSVQIASYNSNDQWSTAVNKAKQWIHAGVPY
ncbi:hypothetical protein [Prochlorococcus marinus]|uniref:hypothetical protein n=1 Tax=Prochlorococcus marinus TaxID=1219 RepID=UPI0007B3A5BF|nr:hypothetical protein [Prochlorococcus marinus]KZR73253.1 hypothetical protein PMIT1320_01844 [Prochlorococcus marinus str. MIT 1320]